MDGKCPLAGCTARPWFSVERAPNSKPEKVKTYDLFWCGKCQHGFISPTPSWDLLNDYYDSYHLNSAGSQGQGRPRGLMDRAIQHIAWRLNWGTPLLAALRDRLSEKKARVLDIGCATGVLLAELRADGHEVCGVEPSTVAREKALANGLTVFEGTAESPPEELKERHFDLIVMSHVLEHCTDPMAAIEKTRDMLCGDGLLAIEVPNNAAAGLSICGLKWFHMDIPRHISYFTPESLRFSLQSKGFKIVNTSFNHYCRQFGEGYISGGVPFYRERLLLSTMFATARKKYDSVIVIAARAPLR